MNIEVEQERLRGLPPAKQAFELCRRGLTNTWKGKPLTWRQQRDAIIRPGRRIYTERECLLYLQYGLSYVYELWSREKLPMWVRGIEFWT